MDAAFPDGGRGSVSGVGIGLRDPHFEQLMSKGPAVPWLELLADNFLARGGLQPRQLERIAQRYPVTLHCVGMNLGGVDPLDFGYLDDIRRIAKTVGAAWISDHLCFTSHAGRHYHDLLPLPFSDEAVRHIADRIVQVQEFLGQRMVVENVSAYLRVEAPLTESEFLIAVCAEADCELLLDVNNLYVNQVNLGLDAGQALRTLPLGGCGGGPSAMNPGLKRSVIEHLESKRLNEAQFRELDKLQQGEHSWLSIRRRRIKWVMAACALLLFGAVFLHLGGPDVANEIANEVALNHLKQRPLEVEGADMASLQAYFAELDFRLVQTSFDDPARDRMLGGRYCSIQGVTAAQLRLSDDKGRIKTLYQVPYEASRFGALPDIGSGEIPWVTQVRGLTVELWVEKGLLFALTHE
jgi:hypothetical protein